VTLAPQLRQTLRQRTVLAPALRGSLAVLRMPLGDLQAEIAHELAENPFLRRRGPVETPSRGAEVMAETLAAEPSLLERLRSQIGLMPLTPEVRAMAEHLAGELREDGYLEAGLEEIAAELGVPLALADAGLAALQGCDPAGVGARSLSECLALQLVDRGLALTLATRVVARIEGFVTRDWRGLSAALGLPRPELERIAALLPELVAHSVAAPAPREGAILLPDLVLETGRDGALRLHLSRESAPRLVLDTRLLAQAAGSPMAAAARSRAEALIAAVAARGETLLRIGRHLVQAQRAFVQHGPDHLQPLTRSEVASALGLHVSTVARAVAGKAIEIDGRVLPLGRFLSAPLPQSDGPALAGVVVRRRIARMIAEERAEAPLSDAALQQRLAAEGVDIARRTVAKYRQWLRLPSSHHRRRNARLRAPAGNQTGRDRAPPGGPSEP
jgi:RNA polymerase sigma-54 factor